MMFHMKASPNGATRSQSLGMSERRTVPGDLVALAEVADHGRPWATERRLREARAKRELPVWVLGSRTLLVSLKDVDDLLRPEPAKRGPLAGRR